VRRPVKGHDESADLYMGYISEEILDAVYAHRVDRLRKIFHLGPDQAFIDDYGCGYELAPGHLVVGHAYVFTGFFCFKESGLGSREDRRTWKWPFSQMKEIIPTKDRWLWGTSITITMLDSGWKIFLRGFASRNKALERLQTFLRCNTLESADHVSIELEDVDFEEDGNTADISKKLQLGKERESSENLISQSRGSESSSNVDDSYISDLQQEFDRTSGYVIPL